MFRLATLLALGTSYLLVFAWIEEASALDVTRSASANSEGLAGRSYDSYLPEGRSAVDDEANKAYDKRFFRFPLPFKPFKFSVNLPQPVKDLIKKKKKKKPFNIFGRL
ncbi:uncharacterized protein [Porites lutea]|uniref:uncharacterized protein n=1 Tax=Porites lutea TaxID=51062 RepID=UPI003CC6D371